MGAAVVVVEDGDRRYVLSGRVAAIVRWLAGQAERVAAPSKVALTFDCAGSSVHAEVRERERVEASSVK